MQERLCGVSIYSPRGCRARSTRQLLGGREDDKINPPSLASYIHRYLLLLADVQRSMIYTWLSIKVYLELQQ